jgi:hypothetical protein
MQWLVVDDLEMLTRRVRVGGGVGSATDCSHLRHNHFHCAGSRVAHPHGATDAFIFGRKLVHLLAHKS